MYFDNQHFETVSTLTTQIRTNFRESGSALLLQRSFRRPYKTMNLEQLLSGCPVTKISGNLGIAVTGIAMDSRRVSPGSVFFAMPGRRTDGIRHIEEAAERGAVAVIAPAPCWVPPRMTLVQVDDIRGCLAAVARRFYSEPQEKLELAGVCGTSGKTVVAALLRHFLSRGDEVGLIGTNQYILGKRSIPAYRTTPEPIELFGMLAQMAESGCTQAIMEISSHGIEQDRIKGLPFRTGIFTNLSAEHLDYHGDMDNYFQVIKRFLTGETAGPLKEWVVSTDDVFGKRLLTECTHPETVVTFGFDTNAQFRADDLNLSAKDSRFTLHVGGESVRLVSPLIGAFNVQNVLAAMAAASLYGVSPIEAAGSLIDFEGVRGRMEKVDEGQDFAVVVDYAHTEMSYRKALDTLRAVTPGRLITVFGCGGDRDPGARPLVTRAVICGSDECIATADNPRHEDLDTIFSHMRAAVRGDDSIVFIEDRRQAIAEAICRAAPGDTVLIAGKGHETFQEFGDSVTPFDDRAVARDILRNRKLSDLP